MRDFKNNKNATETAKKISSVYDRGGFTDCQVRNWFSNICSIDTLLRNEPRAGHSSDIYLDALRQLVECNLGKSAQKLNLTTTHPNAQYATT